MKRTLLISVILAAMLLSACATPATTPELAPTPTPVSYPTVVYEITGSARSASVTLANRSGGTEQYGNVSIPWSYTDKSFSERFLYVSAQNQGDRGTITVSIYVNGKLFKTSSSSGAYVIATASGYR
jgi:hypothetical protein